MPDSFSLITSWDKVYQTLSYLTASDRGLGSGWPGVGQRLGSGWTEVGQWLGSGWAGPIKKGMHETGYRYLHVSHIPHNHPPLPPPPPTHTHTHTTQFKKHIGIYYNVLCSLLTLELKFEIRSLLRRVFVLIGCEFNIASDDEIRSFSVPS